MRRLTLAACFLLLACAASPRGRESTLASVTGVVVRAERERLAPVLDSQNQDKWIEMVVTSDHASPRLGLKFYRAYNASVDPSWHYSIAMDDRGTMYKLGGFPTSDFSVLVQRLTGDRGLSEAAELDVVAAYFSHVEHLKPGLIRSSKSSRIPKAALQCNSIPPRVTERDDAVTISAVVFDAQSSTVECIHAELSSSRGFRITSRRSVVAGNRTDM